MTDPMAVVAERPSPPSALPSNEPGPYYVLDWADAAADRLTRLAEQNARVFSLIAEQVASGVPDGSIRIPLDVVRELEGELDGLAALLRERARVRRAARTGDRRSAVNPFDRRHRCSAALAAAVAGVSRRSVEYTKRVRVGAPDLLPRIKAGEINLPAAVRELERRERAWLAKDAPDLAERVAAREIKHYMAVRELRRRTGKAGPDAAPGGAA